MYFASLSIRAGLDTSLAMFQTCDWSGVYCNVGYFSFKPWNTHVIYIYLNDRIYYFHKVINKYVVVRFVWNTYDATIIGWALGPFLEFLTSVIQSGELRDSMKNLKQWHNSCEEHWLWTGRRLGHSIVTVWSSPSDVNIYNNTILGLFYTITFCCVPMIIHDILDWYELWIKAKSLWCISQYFTAEFWPPAVWFV